MAKVVELERTTFDRRSIHEPVASCLYDFHEVDSQRLLEIKTYGRKGRKTSENPSQAKRF